MTRPPAKEYTEIMPPIETKFRYFETAQAAWRFMRECEARGWSVGFPSLHPGPDGYTVAYVEPSDPVEVQQ